MPELGPILDLARREGTGEVSDAAHLAGRNRLIAALAADRPSRSAVTPALLLAAVALAVTLFVWWPRQPVELRVEGAELAANGSIAPHGVPAVARFGDGSVLTLAAESVGRISEVDAAGARIVLEHGRAHMLVVHRPNTRFTVEAGAYTVRITGTEFDIAWTPAGSTLEVTMQHGSVEVTGPLAPTGVAVREGQVLSASASSLEIRQTSVTAGSHAPTPEPSVATAPAPATSLAVPDASGPANRGARPTWTERVASGDFIGVLAEAEARGLEQVLSAGSVDELSALADAARHGDRGELAKRALEALRRRFAGTAAARTATFLLARTADGGGALDHAIALYDEYLTGGGPLAAEALGRKMMAEDRAGRGPAAHATAVRYLESFPKGPHSAAARKLAGRSDLSTPRAPE